MRGVDLLLSLCSAVATSPSRSDIAIAPSVARGLCYCCCTYCGFLPSLLRVFRREFLHNGSTFERCEWSASFKMRVVAKDGVCSRTASVSLGVPPFLSGPLFFLIQTLSRHPRP